MKSQGTETLVVTGVSRSTSTTWTWAPPHHTSGRDSVDRNRRALTFGAYLRQSLTIY
jgi:hypothetical protein